MEIVVASKEGYMILMLALREARTIEPGKVGSREGTHHTTAPDI